MAVFNPSSTSTCSRSRRHEATNARPKSGIKAPKPTKPSLVQRVSSTVKPKPKPKPSLLRQAYMNASGFDVSAWEKRTWKWLTEFPNEHPILVKVLGTGLCLASMGAGAITLPAVMAAMGAQITVAGGLSAILGAAGASTAAAAHGATVASSAAASAKILLGSVAMDVGANLLARPTNVTAPTQHSRGRWFPRRRAQTSLPEPSPSASNVIGPLLNRGRKQTI